jgi:MscS family membrane protein
VAELFDALIHPSKWSQLGELSARQRSLAALLVLGLFALFAVLVGSLAGRWAQARSTQSGAGGVNGRIRGVRRHGVLFFGSLGIYLAAEIAPLPKHVDSFVTGLSYVLGAIALARLATHLIAILLTTSAARVEGDERARLEREYVPLFSKIAAAVVWLLLIAAVAKHFGQDVSSLVAALGIGSLAIGLAAQQTLGNMFAGFVLNVDRPFRLGDRIKLATGEVGEVLEVGVRSTRILLADRNLLVVPNAELANSRVTNFAMPTNTSAAEVRLTLAHGADVETATRILVELCKQDERILDDAQPLARVAGITPQGVEVVVVFRVARNADAAPVEDQLRKRILERFAEVRIPFARDSRFA